MGKFKLKKTFFENLAPETIKYKQIQNLVNT